MTKAPESGKVVLKAVYGRTGAKLTASPVFDKRTGKYLGVPEISVEKQNATQPITITKDSFVEIAHDTEFDLDNSEVDKLRWAFVKHNSKISMSLEDSFSNDRAMFYVDQPGLEDEKAVARLRMKNKAAAIAGDLTQAQMTSYLKYWGSRTEHMTPREIERAVLEIAEKEPKKFLDATADSNFRDQIFVYALIDARKIRKNASGHLLYGDTLIGQNMQSALQWLKDPRNRDVAGRLIIELKNDKPDLEVSGSLFEALLKEDETTK